MSESQQQRHSHRRRQNNNNTSTKQEGPKRDAILDLNKYKDQVIRVKFIGGRQVTGVLKGFDQLMNLVLDNVTETIRDSEDDSILTEKTRQLGFVVVRCTSLLTISPADGTEEIDNPFVTAEE